MLPVLSPQGSFITYENKNYYAVENNLWSALYYQTNFNPLNGPTKASPEKFDSPYVITSVTQQTELVTDSWQGYVPDPLYNYYTNLPSPYNENLSYMRGCVVPYTEFGVQYQYDDDDSSPSLGIIFKLIPLETDITVMVAPSTVSQTPVQMTSPFVAEPTFGRPEVLRLELLSVQQILLPKEGVSILQLVDPALGTVE